jgi:hypothetical protein
MAEHLHHVVVLQLLHCFAEDISILKEDIHIDPGYELPVRHNSAQMLNAKPDRILLYPELLIRPQAEVEGVLGIGNLERPSPKAISTVTNSAPRSLTCAAKLL